MEGGFETGTGKVGPDTRKRNGPDPGRVNQLEGGDTRLTLGPVNS